MACSILSLQFSAAGPTTSMRVVRQDPPWRALRSFSNSAGEALAHLHNVSGGILAGDSLRLEASLTPNAQAQITTVGATRIYRHRAGASDATHTSVFHVAAGALLEYLPDPVIPFARSRFAQSTEIYLSDGAGLICWEILSAGRVSCGEAFHFDSYNADTLIQSPQGPLAIERYSLSPAASAMNSPARMGPFLYSATMYVCRIDRSFQRLDLEHRLNQAALELSGPDAHWAASSLAQYGVVVRGMVCRAHQASQGLCRLWQTAKLAVWGREALIPRKIY